MNPAMMDMREVATRLSVSIRTVERLIASGELRAVPGASLCPRDARGARRVYFRPAMPIRKRADRFQVRVSLGGSARGAWSERGSQTAGQAWVKNIDRKAGFQRK